MFLAAIIGRPNVGKSTLFNRIAGRRIAIVDDQPGVTRDRKEHHVQWGDLSFCLIDTAGLEIAAATSLEGRMSAQTEHAIIAADICLFLIDARSGVTPLDAHFASFLRNSGKPVLLLANKCEGQAGESGFLDAFSLGLGTPLAVSAEHGDGVADLYQALRLRIRNNSETGDDDSAGDDPAGDDPDRSDSKASDESRDDSLRVAIVGRPNVGKSTLINHLIGEDRLLTGAEAGITRDAIPVSWMWRNAPILLHDTAGLRRKSRIHERLEKKSSAGTLNAIRFAHVVIILIDSNQFFEKQDLQIADMIAQEGRAAVIAVNKWDLVRKKDEMRKRLRERADHLLPQMRGIGITPVSAKSGYGMNRLMTAVLAADEIWNRRIPTAALNRFLEDAVSRNPPPMASGRRVRLRYMTQPKSRPPTFVVFSQRAGDVPESYVRYLINALRESFDLPGVPIRLHIRKGENPYV